MNEKEVKKMIKDALEEYSKIREKSLKKDLEKMMGRSMLQIRKFFAENII